MKNVRKRLYEYEAKELGYDWREPEDGRKNTPYTLTPEQWKHVQNKRAGRYLNPKRLFFDIETSPNIGYFWRSGWKLQIGTENIIEERKIICISYKWAHSDEIHTLKWDANQCDKQMLIEFMRVIRSADELVGHNGDRFDLKWLRTRCIFHRIPMFPSYRTFDTLKKARGGFYFNSNRLDYIAQFLGVGAKLPHTGFQLWKDVMSGCPIAMEKMIQYCENDVVILEDVYNAMSSYVKPNTHAGMHRLNKRHTCPTCASEDIVLLKNDFTAKGSVKRIMECGECESVFDVSNKVYLDWLKEKFAGIEF